MKTHGFCIDALKTDINRVIKNQCSAIINGGLLKFAMG